MATEASDTIARILKVNHAGEYGAIRIYGAQLLVSKLCHKELVPFLRETLGHEIQHCKHFKDYMQPLRTRPCRAMWLWATGGWLLGFVTACMGKNAVMICTMAVEKSVHQHLEDQIAYLKDRDPELMELIITIQKEEVAHLKHSQARIKAGFLLKPLSALVAVSTEVVIWLSTQGDVTRMKQTIRR